MIFVDTNYFLRFLLDDVPEQHKKVKRLFDKGLSGDLVLFTSTIVMFEIVWVLSSTYKKPKDEIIRVLEGLLAMKFIDLEERDIFNGALSLFKESILEFEDCYNWAYAKERGMTKMASFDKKLKRYV